MTDGSLYGTGSNYYGELGLGNYDDVYSLTLIQIPDSKTPKYIDCGIANTVVFMTDGSLYGTGSNTTGELGLGYNSNANNNVKRLTIIPIPNSKIINYIVCGEFSIFALMTDGSLYVTGFNREGQLGLGDYDIYPENGDYEVINSLIVSRENTNLRFLFFTIEIHCPGVHSP
jgi:alpha-tubulin suppressor-like RCC1 family protein